jgi:hypothetical protein
MRVLCEERAVEKKGTRSTCPRRRTGYMQVFELTKNSRNIRKKYRAERTHHAHQKRRLAQLQIYKPVLELLEIGDVKHDILKFCTNIIATHRTNSFGGKLALWNFMTDVATNINYDPEGFRYNKNTKSFAQTHCIYGGKQMCDFFSLNFAGPSYSSIKREGKKGV